MEGFLLVASLQLWLCTRNWSWKLPSSPESLQQIKYTGRGLRLRNLNSRLCDILHLRMLNFPITSSNSGTVQIIESMGHLKGKLRFLVSIVKEYQNNSITFNRLLLFNLFFNISTFKKYYLNVEENIYYSFWVLLRKWRNF